jgi:GT2 family glycosyltransferase
MGSFSRDPLVIPLKRAFRLASDLDSRVVSQEEAMVGALIQCVVVLYKQRPDEAESLISLLEICRQNASIADNLRIFIQDNSPEAHPPPPDIGPLCIEYFHAPANPGLPSAYNKGIEMARHHGASWLLLLDQDTVLDCSFLLQLLEAVQGDISQEACAFVPKLVKGDRVCSPHTIRMGSYIPLPLDFSGFTLGPLVPCNSASCLKIQALEAIGGFPEEYWLDYLDFIVFHRLQAAGGRVYVLDSRLEHSLSVLNLEAEMSVARYSNMLTAEWRFIRETGARGGPLMHRLRLLKRALRHALMLSNKSYASQTLRAVVR